ncbi:MAG TPA: hypothetical protein VLH81_03580 [Desulfobacterales bacterium]|nr:hypothetical protein [Desulfobacterales bacterium]
MIYTVGDLLTYDFTVTRSVDGASQLHDPDVLQVSLCRGDGSEDTLTYGGTESTDANLTRTAEGAYTLKYQLIVAGMWSIRVRTGDSVGGATEWRKSKKVTFQVIPDRHTFTDVTPSA